MFSFRSSCLLGIAFASTFTSAKVFEQYSLDDQLPLIPRVGQFFNWTISPNTFTSDCGSITHYTTSLLPNWATFDPTTRSLYGTPSEEDIGTADVIIKAYDVSNEPASSWCSLYVTKDPPPILNYPIEKQFYNGNPSLSSVFVPGPLSALSSAITGEPTLRIPCGWSFSIGFDWRTFTNDLEDVRYAVLQRDGSPLPDWIRFSSSSITLDGTTPTQCETQPLTILPLSLHAIDHAGHTWGTLPLTIFLADHELCKPAQSLPAINITADASFNVPLNSVLDFFGAEIDGKPLYPQNITELLVDVSGYDGTLTYNSQTRTLSGLADHRTTVSYLPTSITAFKQIVKTMFPLKIEPSFFNSTEFPPLTVGDDGAAFFSLQPFFSNATDEQVKLSAVFDPPAAGNYLHFDSQTAILSGVLPPDFAYPTVPTTFTAYSTITHSTSHARLQINFSPHKQGYPTHHPASSSLSENRRKMILGLSITFGIVGGLVAIACLLAAFRRCARVKDTAIEGEAGQTNWSEKDKEWYGLQDDKVGYGWTEGAQELGGHRMGLDLERSPGQNPRSPRYGDIGLGLRRVLERSQSELNQAASDGPQSPGVISKREFVAKIKETVRNVSDRYTRSKRPQLKNHGVVIGKPILLHRSQSSSLRAASPATMTSVRPDLSAKGSSRPESVATPATVHFVDSLSRHDSGGSTSSLESMVIHASEAVVRTASRTTSLARQTPPERPRLVPFTSATQVPIPQMSISSPDGSDASSSIMSARVTSQTAQANMWEDADVPHTPSQSNDELSMGIHYVRVLGADQAVEAAQSTLTVSTHVRSSFSSLESSNNGHDKKAIRMIVRVGEQFKFRVPVVGGDYESNELEARLTSGEKIPAFLRVDFSEARRRSNGSNGTGAVEFYGLPGVNNVGDLDVRVCTKIGGEHCIARVLLQVVKRS